MSVTKRFAMLSLGLMSVASISMAQGATPANSTAPKTQVVESPQETQGRELVVKYAQHLDSALRDGDITEVATAAGQLEMSSHQLDKVAKAGTPTSNAAKKMISIARAVKKQADLNTLADADKTLTELNEQLAVISPNSNARAEGDTGTGLTSGTATAHGKIPAPGTDSKPVALGNKLCPISGHGVGSMDPGAEVVYKGYRIGMCCNECKAEFMKNPDANLKKVMAMVNKSKP